MNLINKTINLKNISFLAHLSENHLNELNEFIEIINIQADDFIIHKDDECLDLYFLVQGKLLMSNDSGVVKEIKPGGLTQDQNLVF